MAVYRHVEPWQRCKDVVHGFLRLADLRRQPAGVAAGITRSRPCGQRTWLAVATSARVPRAISSRSIADTCWRTSAGSRLQSGVLAFIATPRQAANGVRVTPLPPTP
jgi:hypothetical protein